MITALVFIELGLIMASLIVMWGVDGTFHDFVQTLVIFNAFVIVIGLVSYGVCFALVLGA